MNAVEDVLKVGDKLHVKIVNIDDRGKIDLVRPELEGKVAPRAPREPRSGDRGDRGPRRDFGDRGDRGPRREGGERREFSGERADRGPRPERTEAGDAPAPAPAADRNSNE